MAYEELQVPGEPGVWFCARHKNIQTRLRCGRCEKPICPKCTVMGPVGARCRECASNRDSHMYQVGASHMALAFGASAVLGGVGAALSQVIGGYWFWILLYAPAVGPIWGGAITRITGGKRGAKVATIVSLGLIAGALVVSVGMAWFMYSHALGEMEPGLSELPPKTAAQARRGMAHMPLSFVLTMALFNFPLWIFVILAIAGVWWWLK